MACPFYFMCLWGSFPKYLIDPERDALSIASFTPPDVGGIVTETVAPSGLPALMFEPDLGESGTATFSYRPVDSFGAIGEPVEVTVEIAQPRTPTGRRC